MKFRNAAAVRTARLLTGLALYGVSNALLIQAALGGSPWIVFYQGATRLLPLSFGAIAMLVPELALLAWIPLKQSAGVGALANAFLVGPFTDLTLGPASAPDSIAFRCTYLVVGIVLCALATALSIGARLGVGPRGGLTVGLSRTTGRSVRSVRTGVEVSALVLGAAMGGVVGAGAALFALTIGPMTQLSMTLLEPEAA